MIKIINVISDTNIGGAGKCVLTFLKTFDRAKFDVGVAVPKGSLLKSEIQKMNIKIFEVNGMVDKSMDLKVVRTLCKYLKSEQPDVVHTHASLSAKVAARLAGVKGIIYTRHCVYPPSPLLMKGPGRHMNRWLNHTFSDRIIAVAEAAKENLTDTGISSERIQVILNGVEKLEEISEQEKQLLKEEFGIQKDEFVVGIIARLEEVKGHEYFIEAAKLVLACDLPVKFLIVGTGTQEKILKQKVNELGLNKKVIFAGFISNVTGIMNIIDINVNASYGTEATSLSLLEGMSLGKPAVVTAFGGNPGVIFEQQNGFLVPIKDAQKMSEAIIRLLKDDKLRANMNAQCKKIFENLFTAQVMTANIEKAYKELAQRQEEK